MSDSLFTVDIRTADDDSPESRGLFGDRDDAVSAARAWAAQWAAELNREDPSVPGSERGPYYIVTEWTGAVVARGVEPECDWEREYSARPTSREERAYWSDRLQEGA